MNIKYLTKYIDNLNFYRDGEFDVLGLIVSEMDLNLLTFVEKEEYINQLSNNISSVICKPELVKYLPKRFGIIISERPRITFFKIHNCLSENAQWYYRKKFSTIIGHNCNIDKSAIISDKNVIIGNNVTIEDFVVIRENVVIKDNSIIRAGSKIGGVGFEYKRDGNEIIPVKHSGGVIIGKNVEIQYNTCVDRAIYPWDNTIIDDDTKIDNLVHIAHAVKIGKRCFLPAGTVISGRVEIGSDTWIGVGCVISNGIKIGSNSRANIGSVVTKDIEDGQSVTGNFAIDHNKFINFIKKLNKEKV